MNLKDLSLFLYQEQNRLNLEIKITKFVIFMSTKSGDLRKFYLETMNYEIHNQILYLDSTLEPRVFRKQPLYLSEVVIMYAYALPSSDLICGTGMLLKYNQMCRIQLAI